MDNKLFLKQRDYELIKYKSTLPFNQSRNDPLINPKLKKNKNARANLFNQNQKDNKKNIKVNPLSQKQNNNKNELIEKQQQFMKIQTPWSKILASFIKSYDVMKESLNLQLANPFGSYGIKVQDQMKELANTQNKPKIQQKINEQRSTITIKTYLKILQIMKKDLENKWKAQDKVACLQIAIQACKLLHDTSNAKFHALKFAYVVEIVDRFGILVFQRLKKLSFPHLNSQKLEELTLKNIMQSNIPQSAQQIARNWLLKIASIRQLLPRTIIETTLLRLHFFINNGKTVKMTMQRLYKSNRCFGQYMNCIFFCTFLVRMGKQALPLDKDYILHILQDVFIYIKQGQVKFRRQQITYDQFMKILQPFFITSFESLSQSLQKQKFKKFFSILPSNPHSVIIQNIITNFNPSYLSLYSIQIVQMIQKNPQDTKYKLYQNILQRIRGIVFNQSGQFIILVWTDINQIKDIQILLDLLGPFSQIIFRNLPNYQKNKFYGLILQKFNSLFENFRGLSKRKIQKFQNFLSQIIVRTQDVKNIVTLQPFLQLISYFPQKSKQQISYNIIKTFVNKINQKIKDPVVVHILLSLIKNLSGYKIKNQQSQIEELVLKFIDLVDFVKDWEQFLNCYAQIRASFGYFQKVTVSIIYKAAGLTYRSRNANNGKLTNKLISFLQAAIAFCYITVPVIQSPQIKLKMYLFLGQVSLSNNLISQSTSLIKTCITELSEASLKNDIQIYAIFYRLISFMIVIPDDPQKDFLFLFNGLFQAFEVSKFKTNLENMVRFQFYTNCLTYLCSQAQQKLPFHLQGVTSNDALFKSKQFKAALIQKIYQIFGLIQKMLDLLQKSNTNQSDNYIIFNLPQCIMTMIDIFEDSERIQNFYKKVTKIITLIKDRVLRSQNNPQNSMKIKRSIQGLNQKFKQNHYNYKII